MSIHWNIVRPPGGIRYTEDGYIRATENATGANRITEELDLRITAEGDIRATEDGGSVSGDTRIVEETSAIWITIAIPVAA